MKGTIIFTGGAYYLVQTLPPKGTTADFVIGKGQRWVKARRAFAHVIKDFACSPHYQVLTEAEAKAQGLVS